MLKIHSKEDFTLFCSLFTDSVYWLPEDGIEETKLSYIYRLFKTVKGEEYFVQVQWLKYNKKFKVHCINLLDHTIEEREPDVHKELREDAIRAYELLNIQKSHLNDAKEIADAFNSLYEKYRRVVDESGYVTRAMKMELFNRGHKSMKSLIKVKKSVAMPVSVNGIIDKLFLDISEKSALVEEFPTKKPSWNLWGKLFSKKNRELVR